MAEKNLFKEVVQGVKTNNRWATAFSATPAPKLTLNERNLRGELIRQIKAISPDFIGADTLSLYHLEDVQMSQNVLQINRLHYNR